MTFAKDPFFKELPNLARVFVGLDEHFDRLQKIHADTVKNANYPPYNIRRLSELEYVVEIAAAGFCQEDFDITAQNGMLTVKAQVENEDKSGPDMYIHRGIAKRAFTRSFVLDEYIEVKSASFDNGILSVYLETIIPEHKQPKKIAITGPNSKQKLLLG